MGPSSAQIAIPDQTPSQHSCTIVIPTRDRPKLLRRAVRSALMGLAGLGEVLVIDDHSTIPAKDVLRMFSDQRLRVVRLPEGQTGVSTARNTGIAQSRGDVVFFLDDDDELLPGYCAHVLQNGARDHDYGFSNYLETRDNRVVRLIKPARFPQGPIPPNASLGPRLCGFGMGFWIRRDVALDMGEVCTDLSINEDTEYLCRLITANRSAWYSTRPGVVLYLRDQAVAGELHHLTQRATAQERARCMGILCNRYPHMAAHLGLGYIRHCLKSGASDEARRFVAAQTDWRRRTRMTLFALTKTVAYRLTGRVRPAG